MREFEVLLKEIEVLRAELNIIVSGTDSLTSKKVVKKSKELDKVLNEYYDLLRSMRD